MKALINWPEKVHITKLKKLKKKNYHSEIQLQLEMQAAMEAQINVLKTPNHDWNSKPHSM